MTEYAKCRQQFLNDLRARFDGKEMICKKEAAMIYGYVEARDADHILSQIPHYNLGKKVKYAIGDIASDLAHRQNI